MAINVFYLKNRLFIHLFSILSFLMFVGYSFPVANANEILYINDAGFEQGVSGFTGNGVTQISLNTDTPLAGSSSLQIVFSNWSSTKFLKLFDWNASPFATALTAQINLRVDQASENAVLQLCARANYEDGTTDEECTLQSLTSQLTVTMTSSLPLDSTKHLMLIRLGLQLRDTGSANITIDPATLVLTSVNVEANTTPNASFTSNSSNASSLAVDFDASGSIDSDGSIVDYAWDFGDGSSGNGAILTHQYSSAGDYTVTLTVTDNAGSSDSVSADIFVSGSVTTSDAQYAMLTPARLQMIQSNIAINSTTWDTFANIIDQEVSAGHGYIPNDSGNNWRYLLAPMALRIVADPDPVTQPIIDFYQANYLSALATSDFTSGLSNSRNEARQYMGDFARAFIWTSKHIPDFWSQENINLITAKFNEWMQHWVIDYETSFLDGTLVPQDSDESISIAEALQLYAETGLLNPTLQSEIERVRDTVAETVMDIYFHPETGLYAEGMPFESPNYQSNTPRFALGWFEMMKARGRHVSDPEWPVKFARVAILMMIRDNTSNPSDYHGTWLYNDPINMLGSPAIKQNSYPISFQNTNGSVASSFRVINHLNNALMTITPSSPEHRVLKGIVDQISPRVPGSVLNTGYQRILNDNTLLSGQTEENAGTPLFNASIGAQGLVLAKSSANNNASQFFWQSWTKNVTDHWGGGIGHFELYDEGIPLTRYQPATYNLNESVNLYNMVYIENKYNNKPNRMVGNTPLAQYTKSDQHQIFGAAANSDYVTVGSDACAVWNIIGWNQTADYCLQDSRRVISFWDKVQVVYDHIRTDPAQLEDLQLTGSYNRDIVKIQRFESMPSLQNGWYQSVDQGKQLAYKEVLADTAVVDIVDETNQGDGIGLPFAGWLTGHVEHKFGKAAFNASNDVEFMGILAYGSPGFEKPTINPVSITNGSNVIGIHLSGTVNKILLFNRNPSIPIKDSIQFTSTADVIGAEIYLTDADSSTLFSASKNGEFVNIITGMGKAPDAGRVWKGLVGIPPVSNTNGYIVFSGENLDSTPDTNIYRVAADDQAIPQNLSAMLDAISPGSYDRDINISSNGGVDDIYDKSLWLSIGECLYGSHG